MLRSTRLFVHTQRVSPVRILLSPKRYFPCRSGYGYEDDYYDSRRLQLQAENEMKSVKADWAEACRLLTKYVSKNTVILEQADTVKLHKLLTTWTMFKAEQIKAEKATTENTLQTINKSILDYQEKIRKMEIEQKVIESILKNIKED